MEATHLFAVSLGVPTTRATLTLAAVLMLTLTGCGRDQSKVNKAAVSPGQPTRVAGQSTASDGPCSASFSDKFTSADAPYPGWVRADFPPYPSAKLWRCSENVYDFQTGDDPAAVLAWYQTHAAAHWTRGQTPNGWAEWDGWGKDVVISISSPPRVQANGVKAVVDFEAVMRH